jgi:aminoglycoside 6-adenylyltransferase
MLRRMLELPAEAHVLERLVAWGSAEPAVRAMVLTSTRARDDGSADALSDYDVIVAVRGVDSFVATRGWAPAYGPPLVGWGDEHELYGATTYFRGVVYPDGVRIDWTLWPDTLIERVAAAEDLPDDLDVGHRVLLDKDGRTSDWRAPTYRAHIPSTPSEAEYLALFEEFWWDTTYMAKALWRGEIFFAKFALDYDTKFVALRRFLEWRIELDYDWSLRPGAYGRGLERLLPAELVAELEATYVGTGIDENWEALFRTVALFRRVAKEVGEALGHRYPEDIDQQMTAQLEGVRQLGRRQV